MTDEQNIRKAVEAMDDQALLNIIKPKPAYLRRFEKDGVYGQKSIEPTGKHIFRNKKKADGAL